MSHFDENKYKNPVTGEEIHRQLTPRFTGLQTFMRLPSMESGNEKLQGLDIGVIGVPYDAAVTYRTGARMGPREVREKSILTRSFNPLTKVAPYEICRVSDLGDVPFRNGNDEESSNEDIYQYYQALTAASVAPMSIGGDHSISYPILKALAEQSGPLGLIHIDAHVDTLEGFQGAKFSHGSPFFHAVNEGLIDPKKCIQIGIRGSEHQGLNSNSEKFGMRVIYIEEFEELGVDAVIAEARKVVDDAPTYFTFDIDGLDPVYASGTGTPEAGGLTVREANQLIRGCRGLDIIGSDLVEVAPMYDPTEVTGVTAATLLFELTCLLSESVANNKK